MALTAKLVFRSALVMLCITWSSAAMAQTYQSYSITGNIRAQIGNGLPIPITFAPAPNGPILATPNATIKQTITATSAQKIIQPQSVFTFNRRATGAFANIGVWQSNNNVWQVRTSIGFQVPKNEAILEAGGRTGPAVVAWCPGQPLPTASFDPNCTGPGQTGNTIPGFMRYTATANQFGGSGGQANVSGGTPNVTIAGSPADAGAIVALNGGGAAPCNNATAPPCVAASNRVVVAPTGAAGGPFGFFNSTTGNAPSPGVFGIAANANGTIVSVLTTIPAPGATNRPTSFGGPATTGMIEVRVSQTAQGGTEMFTLTGSDGRNTTGVGSLSLVSAAVSTRTLSGPNANRGWTNVNIVAPVPEPGAILAAAGILGALGVCHRMVRRRS